MTPAGTTGARLHLDGAALDRIFPFHLAFDRAGRVARLGPSLRGLLPSLSEGCAVAEHFAVRRPAVPFDFDAVAGKADVLFLLATRAREDLVLRGQMMHLPDQQRIADIRVGLLEQRQARWAGRPRARLQGFRRSAGASQMEYVGLVGTPASRAISTAQSTASSSCCSTRARISTISRSPPGCFSR